MHDLSNLLAQQSLVVENAERFGHNPEFIDDAIGTISHSVTRMRRLMEQLSSVSKPPTKRRVNLCSTIDNAVERTAARQPVPVLTSCDLDIHVQADSERLSMVFEHLLRNAQEATPPDGEVPSGRRSAYRGERQQWRGQDLDYGYGQRDDPGVHSHPALHAL
jgi:signal transduction histidine kinase